MLLIRPMGGSGVVLGDSMGCVCVSVDLDAGDAEKRHVRNDLGAGPVREDGGVGGDDSAAVDDDETTGCNGF